MAQVKFPQIIGVNQLSDETALVDEEIMYVRKAVNVDLDTAGNVSRRKGATLQLAGSGYHSLYKTQRGWLMLCLGHQLGIYTPSTASFTALVITPTSYRTSFTEANGNLYASNPNFSCMFTPGSAVAKPIGVPLPSIPPVFAATSSGALEEGTYGVAYTVVDPDGEESALSEVYTLEVAANGSIQGTLFTVNAGYKYRVYLTAANGEELRQATEFDADTASILIQAPEEGRLAKTFGLEPLPHGHIIRSFGSRLLVGSTGHVYFSEAFRPHLADPTGFVLTTGFTTMVEPVGEGVFIADSRGVRFYAGEDPTNWQAKEASPETVVFGTSMVVSGGLFSGDMAQHDEVAVWLSPTGYQVGLPTGEVIRPNTEQVELPAYSQGCVSTLTSDGRKQLVTPVNSNELAQASVALDSTTI